MFDLALSATRGFSGPIYRADQVPKHFHEHYIVRGYRQPKSSPSQCLLSLFDATNETINVWSHFLPACYFVYVTWQLDKSLGFSSDAHSWSFLCYLVVCVAFPLASAVAHLFNVMSEQARHVCFFLDYSALSLLSFGVAVAYRAYCFPPGLLLSRWPPIVWYCDNFVNIAAFNAILSTFLSCKTRFLPPSPAHKAMRLGAFFIPYLYDSVPILCRLMVPSLWWQQVCTGQVKSFEVSATSSLEQDCHAIATSASGSLYLHGRQFLFTGLAGFLYATHLPERLLPGMFDIIGHSHQLFHVCGIIAVLDQFQAILTDFQYCRSSIHNPLIGSLARDVASSGDKVSYPSSWESTSFGNNIGFLALIFCANAVIAAFFSIRCFQLGKSMRKYD